MTTKTQITMSRFASPVATAVLARGSAVAWRDQAERLLAYAEPVSRAGLYASLGIIYAWFGGMKFTDYEAQGLVPLVENSPLVSWFYALLSVRNFSTFLGFLELGSRAADRPSIGEPDLFRGGRSAFERAVRHDPQLHDLDAGRHSAGTRGAGDLGRTRPVPPEGCRPSRRLVLGVRQLPEGRRPQVSGRPMSRDEGHPCNSCAAGGLCSASTQIFWQPRQAYFPIAACGVLRKLIAIRL